MYIQSDGMKENNKEEVVQMIQWSTTNPWRGGDKRLENFDSNGKKANNTHKMYSEGERDGRPNRTRI